MWCGNSLIAPYPRVNRLPLLEKLWTLLYLCWELSPELNIQLSSTSQQIISCLGQLIFIIHRYLRRTWTPGHLFMSRKKNLYQNEHKFKISRGSSFSDLTFWWKKKFLFWQCNKHSNSNAPILLFLQHDVVDLYYLKLWILLYKNSQRFHHQRSTSFGCKEIEVYKIRDGDKCSNPNKSLHRKKLVLLRKYEKVFDADDIHGKRWNVVEMTFHIFLVKNSRNLKVCFNNCLPFSRVDFTMVY